MDKEERLETLGHQLKRLSTGGKRIKISLNLSSFVFNDENETPFTIEEKTSNTPLPELSSSDMKQLLKLIKRSRSKPSAPSYWLDEAFEDKIAKELDVFSYVNIELWGPSEMNEVIINGIQTHVVEFKMRDAIASETISRWEAGGPFYTEALKFMVQLTSYISQEITQNKTTLDILSDLATIIGVTIPLVNTVFKLFLRKKTSEAEAKSPSVTISIGDVSVSVTNEEIKDAEHAATNIARKLLREHPEALPSNYVKITGELINHPTQGTPSQPLRKVSSQPQKKSRKKRNK